MVFSIPKNFTPGYTLPADEPINNTLLVGEAIKDLPNGTETTMKKNHDVTVIQIKEKFTHNLNEYNQNFQTASLKAAEAAKLIGNARMKKAIAITLVATTAIALAGITAATLATGMSVIAFTAIPFIIGSIPTAYYARIFSKAVANLENTISAPDKLVKPKLVLPTYNPSYDLDLEQSRINVQNLLSSMTIPELAVSEWSKQDIINYALLDRVTAINPDKRPKFYARCIQLINVYGKNQAERNQLLALAKQEYRKLDSELNRWKSDQESYIQNQEWALRNKEHAQIQMQERQKHKHQVTSLTGIVGSVSTAISRWELDRVKASVAENYGRRDTENIHWYSNTVGIIDTAYARAMTRLAVKFDQAKTAAA